MSSIRADQFGGGRVVDNTDEVPGTRAPLVLNMDKFNDVTEQVSRVSESSGAPLVWYVAFVGALGLLGLLGFCVLYLIVTGVGAARRADDTDRHRRRREPPLPRDPQPPTD